MTIAGARAGARPNRSETRGCDHLPAQIDCIQLSMLMSACWQSTAGTVPLSPCAQRAGAVLVANLRLRSRAKPVNDLRAC